MHVVVSVYLLTFVGVKLHACETLAAAVAAAATTTTLLGTMHFTYI